MSRLLLAHAGHVAPAFALGPVLALLGLLVLAGTGLTYAQGAGSAAGPDRPDGPREDWLPKRRPACDVPAGRRVSRTAWVTAAGATGLAGLVHAAVVPEHLEAAPLHALFFAGLALAQGAVALLLARAPSERVRRGAVALSLWLVVLWAASRTSGIALVTVPEPVGLLDGASTLLQLITVLACRGRAGTSFDARPPALLLS